MNEFIIWGKRYRVFRKLLKIDFELGLYFCIDTVVPFEKGELIKYIGLKDINGKSIYTDCSIIEFNNSQLWNKYIGIFFYNKEKLCYQIKIINGNRKNEIIPYDRHCSNFKIIDTIQENKLGLIKA